MKQLDRRFEELSWPQAMKAGLHPGATLIWPFGAIEQHGPHLPLNTDSVFADEILNKVLSKLSPELPVWRLPLQMIGFSPEHKSFAGTLSLESELLIKLIQSLGKQIADMKFKRLVLFNAHGGQIALLSTAARQLRAECPSMAVLPCFMWSGVDGIKDYIPNEEMAHGLHAGLVETSLMLHLKKKLVGPERPFEPRSDCSDFISPPQGWSLEGDAPYSWLTSDISTSGVIGNSRNATGDLGEKLEALLIKHWVKLLNGLLNSQWPTTTSSS